MTEIRGAIAPHVEPDWVEAMLLELRLQGVSGERIGAALAEVEAHVVDSGQNAQEAFGDPVAYARSLDLPPEPEQSRTATLKGVVPTLIHCSVWSRSWRACHGVRRRSASRRPC